MFAGAVKPDGTTTTVSSDGTIHAAVSDTYTLPAASTSTRGGVTFDGVTVKLNQSGQLQVPIATVGNLGLVRVGQEFGTSNDGRLYMAEIEPAPGFDIETDEKFPITPDTKFPLQMWISKFLAAINGLITRTGLATASQVGVVKPDGTTIRINAEGAIRSVGGGTGYPPDDTTIGLDDEDRLSLKDVETYLRNSGPQNINGANSKLIFERAAPATTEAGAAMKISLGSTYSGIAPGAGGDLSILLYGNGTAASDYGFGMTAKALNIQAGQSGAVMNHWINTKNVCKMSEIGMDNVVLKTQLSTGTPVTAATELGIKGYGNSGNNRGFEFRLTGTQLSHLITNGSNFYTRHTSDNGATWGSFSILLNTENTGWV
jgi:hypothetical protein